MIKNKNQNYVPFYFTCFDPNNSFFKSKSNERARVTIYSCSNCENCQAYKDKACALLNGLWGGDCPYGNIHTEVGPTKRAKGCSSFIYKYKEQYKDILPNSFSSANHTYKIGDYIYLGPLYHLSNYVNSIEDCGLVGYEKKFLPVENFTKETVERLINFRPQALLGGTITSYQKENVPMFLFDIKTNFPEMWAELKKDKNYEDVLNSINYKGKKAILQTLKPGTVKVGIYLYNWDGKKLTALAKDVGIRELKEGFVTIEPQEEVTVIVEDNNTVEIGKTKLLN